MDLLQLRQNKKAKWKQFTEDETQQEYFIDN